MRFFFSKASPVQLQFLIWGLVFLFTFLTYLPEDGFAQALTYGLLNIGFYALLIYGNISFLFPRLYQKGRITAYILSTLGLLLSVGVTRALLSVSIYNRFFAKEKEALNVPTLLYYSVAGLLVFMLSFVFRIAIDYFRLKRQAEQMLEQKSQAELNLLKSQVQPHFLFNTLNNIYYEAYREAPRTALLIGRLSDIMRYFVDESPKEKVSLATEVKFLENYIALEEIRVRHGVNVTFHKEYEGELVIPPMLLMTFVENLFKHGIDRGAEGNQISLSLTREDGHLRFVTENRLPKDRPQTGKTGSGLRNLEKRLTLLYGDRFTLSITHTATHFNALLKIPLV
ncbi:MAG TPA: histidine kinase [Puia sp.]|nr:histidine kinase [Puia sp.]